ncbi:MAG: hypothetical protein V4463_25560 [Pseudomonadota bacterium]
MTTTSQSLRAIVLATALACGAAGAAPSKLQIQGYSAAVPAGWVAQEPSSSMRVAQFALPGTKDAEVAAFFFPPGQGGNHEANILRWSSQFFGADGKAGKPTVSTHKAGDTEVTLVELKGKYARGIGMGQQGDAKANQTLLVAMVETPVGRITLQIYGPTKQVTAQRANFLALAQSFKRG